MRLVWAKTLQGMSVPLGKIPNVPWTKIGGLRLPVWRDHSSAHIAFDHERPFRGDGVPMQFAQSAGIQSHRHSRHAFGDGKLIHIRFLRRPAGGHASFGRFDVVLEILQWRMLLMFLRRRVNLLRKRQRCGSDRCGGRSHCKQISSAQPASLLSRCTSLHLDPPSILVGLSHTDAR